MLRTWNSGPRVPLEMSCRELRAPACPIAPRRTLRGSTSTQEDAPVHPLEHLEGQVSLSESTGASRDLRFRLGLLLCFQRSRKPSRCQRNTVSGFTRKKASRHARMRLAKATRSPRSQARNSGFLVLREATMSCCRSAAFSARSSSLVRNMSATNPAATPEGRSVSVSTRRARATGRPMAAVRRLARARSTGLISSTEATTSSLALGDFLNDPVTDEPGSQDSKAHAVGAGGEER